MPPIDGDEDEILEPGDDENDGGSGDGAQGASGEHEGDGDDPEGSAELASDEEAGGEHEVDEPPRRPARGESRVQRLANERREEKARADRLERELSELRRSQQPTPQQETAEQRRTRLSLMTPEERSDYLLNESNERHSRELAMTRLMVEDRMDLQNFNSTLRDNPRLARYKDEVDRIFKEQQERGMFVSRDVILDTVIGRAARAAAGRKAAGGDNQRRVEAQRVNGRSPKGAAPAARQRAGNSAESRLKDVQI